ncbi:MAG: hypothetical protein A2167_04630 [Planctomycetes bacterium RBG_13_46_10]|nr:MAG: hypothetical protein A2167_04630 [Planctomycetes bacterium RBG_13_46_10]
MNQMKQKNENQWLEPLLARHIYREPVVFDFQQWAKRYPRETQLLERGFEDTSQNHETKTYHIWRLIMESKITRYSAAAVILLATVLVLLSPFGKPGKGGVVLADVQKKVAGIETMILRGTKTFAYPGEPDRIFEFDGIKCKFDLVKYHSTQFGLVEEGYAEGKLFYRITLNIPEEQTLILFPKYKKYLKFASTDAIAKVMEHFASPNGILNLLFAGDCKKLGRDKIDGVEVEAFEFRDTEPFEPIKELLPKAVFDIQNFKGKVWIAVKEQMPVRVEGDLSIGKSFTTMFHELNLHEVNTFGDYNIELDEDIFDTNVPEGYTEFKISDILPFIPVKAKVGLAGLGAVPICLIFWKRFRKKKTTIMQKK